MIERLLEVIQGQAIHMAVVATLVTALLSGLKRIGADPVSGDSGLLDPKRLPPRLQALPALVLNTAGLLVWALDDGLNLPWAIAAAVCNGALGGTLVSLGAYHGAKRLGGGKVACGKVAAGLLLLVAACQPEAQRRGVDPWVVAGLICGINDVINPFLLLEQQADRKGIGTARLEAAKTQALAAAREAGELQ